MRREPRQNGEGGNPFWMNSSSCAPTPAVTSAHSTPANHTQRLVHNADRVLLGAHGTYEARCRRCFDPTLSRQDAIVPPAN